MSLLLGDIDNQIRHNFGHPLKVSSTWKKMYLSFWGNL
jgi:hypothetical protein